MDGAGMTVLHANPRPGRSRAYVLANGAGVVLGRLFSKSLARGEMPGDPDLDASASAEILRSGGRYLIERHWGRYVGFFHDEARDQHYVLRDPSGGAPCFSTVWENVRVFFADVQDIIELHLAPLEVNWQYLTAFLSNNHLRIADTGLRGVSELLAGERLAISAQGQSRSFLWNPTQIAENGQIENFDRACELLESTAKICIGAWGSIYDTVLHELSGGLDSAVVLGCLTQAPKRPHVVCHNSFMAAVPESDERHFARIVAARAGCGLIETELRSEQSRLDRQLSIPAKVSPSLMLFSYQHDHMPTFAAQHKLDAIFNGRGGDQIFYRYHKSFIAADYARRFGFRPGLFKIVLDTARLTRSSVWSVLRVAMEHGVFGRSGDAYALSRRDSTLLADSAHRSLERNYHMHPWLIEAIRLPPGKLLHVSALIDLQLYQEPSSDAHVADTPLLFASQPLVELCLRVPTYILTRGGIDRALERTAFTRDVPQEIAVRQTKGRTTRYFAGVLTANLPFLRELLLDGELVRQGLLDRTRLEGILAKDYIVHLAGVGSLLDCVAAEAWLHRWRGVRQQAAA